MGFEWRKAGESAWNPFSGELTKEGTAYSARIGGLEPSTQYEVRAITAAEQSDDNIMSFTTQAADQLPNFNFDSWCKDGKEWYANADLGENYFWDSGNKGANTLSELNPTSPEETFVVSGKAAKLESKYVVIAFAGGNIYSGSFGAVSGLGASINFGQPYTCRPTALHGWYSYAPKEINRTKSPYDNLKGTIGQYQYRYILRCQRSFRHSLRRTGGRYRNQPRVQGVYDQPRIPRHGTYSYPRADSSYCQQVCGLFHRR